MTMQMLKAAAIGLAATALFLVGMAALFYPPRRPK